MLCRVRTASTCEAEEIDVRIMVQGCHLQMLISRKTSFCKQILTHCRIWANEERSLIEIYELLFDSRQDKGKC